MWEKGYVGFKWTATYMAGLYEGFFSSALR